MNEQDILEYGKQGDIGSLVDYIKQNLHDPKQASRVGLAATQLFMQERMYGWERIRELFYSEFDSSLIRTCLLARKKVFDKSFLQRSVATLLQRNNRGDYQDVLNLVDRAIQVGIEPGDSLQMICSVMAKILDLGGISDSLLTEKRQMDSQYKSLQEKVAEIEGWLKQNTPFQLYGFIRAQKEEGVYEITANQEPAILITTDTRFETTGYFQVWANEVADNLSVTLRQEYGGFTQQWKLYREVPEIELETRFKMADDKKVLLEKAIRERSSFKGEPEVIDQQIERIQEQKETLKQRILHSIFYMKVS